MKVAVTDKWIEGTSPGDRTSDVALRTLQSRLGAVLYYLPLATEKAEKDTEYIHQLRVWTRRATTALRLYEDFLPRRRRAWIKKQLKQIRRTANEARDCDVLIERLKKKQSSRGAKRWLESIRAERAKAQKAVVAVYKRLWRGRRFVRRIDKLLERVRCRGEKNACAAARRFGDWARERHPPVLERFFSAVPTNPDDAEALHELRIRGKELRYVLELLAGAFPDELRTKLYPTIKEMQDRLGEINDRGTARARLQEKIAAESDSADAASWRRLLTKEQAQLEQARRQFWAWFTPQLLRELRDGFEALLGHQRKKRRPARK